MIGLRHETLEPGRGLGSLANDRSLGKVRSHVVLEIEIGFAIENII